MQEISNKNLVTINGLVIPVEWDEDGRVVDIAIATYDENQYFIENDLFKEYLHKRIGQTVFVRGIIKKVKNKYTISISKFI
jgi:hypothetical protein